MTFPVTNRTRILCARTGGFLTLFILPVFMAVDMISSRFEVEGDVAQSARRILGNELLYRSGLSLNLLVVLITVLLAVCFYTVLKPVSGPVALFAFSLRLVEAAMVSVETAISFIVLNLYTGKDLGSAFSLEQRAALVKLYDHEYGIAFHIGLVLSCVALFLFNFLLFKARYIPRIISILCMVAAPLIALLGILNLVAPQDVNPLLFLRLVMLVAMLSEGLWLLVKGVRLEGQLV